MKISLYGLPCSGKTTVLSGVNIPVIHGSNELNKLASGRFSSLPEDEKKAIRVKYAQNLSSMEGDLISDGHYSFGDNVVFTEFDAELYDIFIYLYCEPSVIVDRLKLSEKNKKIAGLSLENVKKWQTYEIQALRTECHKRNKDFYVVKDITPTELQGFIEQIKNGYSSYGLGKKIAEEIRAKYPEPCLLCLCDGDKTVIKQDSFRICTDNYITHVFDGDFYTGYQALKFEDELDKLSFNLEKIDEISINDAVFNRIKEEKYVILSSGVKSLWDNIAKKFGFKFTVANTRISADTKFFVVKILQEYGYNITAYGDSKNDLYMLKQANKAYLCIGKNISRSLENTDVSGIKLIYNKETFILSEVDRTISDDINICKSSSGINGCRLAEAHIQLGRKMGEHIHRQIPNVNTAILCLERSGRFFSDGLYCGFGGTLYSFDPQKNGIPDIKQDSVIICDGVINTGKTLINIIEKLREVHPNIEIFIASNVLQKNAIQVLKDYKIFTVRVSENSYVGCNQSMQVNGKGPDTADRLFNYI